MGWLTIVAAFALFLLVIILPAVLLGRAYNRARDRRISEFAWAMEFSYRHTLPGDVAPLVVSGSKPYRSVAVEQFLRPFGDCPFFGSGSFRAIENIVQGGRRNTDWLIFDYHCWTESRYDESERLEATCVVGYADGNLGRFSIEPKLPLIGRMGARFEPTGLVEVGDPEFDRMFLVRAPAPAHALRCLGPAVRDYLLRLRRGHDRWYRHAYVHDNMVIIVEPHLASAKHIGAMMDIARHMLDLLAEKA